MIIWIPYSIYSSVVVATGYRLDDRCSIPNRGKIFLLSVASRPALGFTQPPIQLVLGAISPMVNRLGREADQSPPSSAEVKKGGTIPPLPQCLHGILLN
jgi:hypothetical protein